MTECFPRRISGEKGFWGTKFAISSNYPDCRFENRPFRNYITKRMFVAEKKNNRIIGGTKMAEKLQSLLDRINEKGVKEAEAAAANIIAAAEKEAAAIRAKAKAEAEATAREAAEKADALEKRAEAAVRQAARDIVLELREELQRRMTRAVADTAGQAMTPEFMTSLIREFAAKFATDPNGQMTVLTAVKNVPALDQALKAAAPIGVALKDAFRGGFEVGFKGGEVYFDFTEDAVTALVAEYIGPRLAAILKGE